MSRRTLAGGIVYMLVMLIIVFVCVFHDGIDDEGLPNLPYFNERANACYVGASLQGTCVTETDWRCGWVWIRLENNILTRDEVPDECAALLSDTQAS